MRSRDCGPVLIPLYASALSTDSLYFGIMPRGSTVGPTLCTSSESTVYIFRAVAIVSLLVRHFRTLPPMFSHHLGLRANRCPSWHLCLNVLSALGAVVVAPRTVVLVDNDEFTRSLAGRTFLSSQYEFTHSPNSTPDDFIATMNYLWPRPAPSDSHHGTS